ncbi:MAG: hypothetical protein MHMPM18_001124 [Marteilia pararefringens]
MRLIGLNQARDPKLPQTAHSANCNSISQYASGAMQRAAATAASSSASSSMNLSSSIPEASAGYYDDDNDDDDLNHNDNDDDDEPEVQNRVARRLSFDSTVNLSHYQSGASASLCSNDRRAANSNDAAAAAGRIARIAPDCLQHYTENPNRSGGAEAEEIYSKLKIWAEHDLKSNNWMFR